MSSTLDWMLDNETESKYLSTLLKQNWVKSGGKGGMSDEQEKYQYRKSEINQGTSPTQHKYKGSFTYYVIHFGQFLDPHPYYG